jgi:hypothetical protein
MQYTEKRDVREPQAQRTSDMIGGLRSAVVQVLIVIVFRPTDWCLAQLIDLCG